MNAEKTLVDFTLAFYSGDRQTGSIAIVEYRDGVANIKPLDVADASGLEKVEKPVFIGLTEDYQIIELEPKTQQLHFQSAFTADAFAAHIYPDPNSRCNWYMNDGDKENGNDTVNCGDKGSSVSVVDDADSAKARLLKTICVGRGHHQAAFSFPADTAAHVPNQTYISNLKDGTISVIGNEVGSDNYLKLIATIDLCEPDKEKVAGENNAFPHGLVYSKLSGKIYNLNNGYGTVTIIDPVTHKIESRIELKGFSNLFMSPDSRYILARGADRKSDAQHVIAKLAVIDVTNHEIVTRCDLPDVYISKYYFNPEGTKLYLTTSSKGSPEQIENLKADVLLAFDMTALPAIKQVAEVTIGASGSLSFLERDGSTALIFSTDSSAGGIVVLDGSNHEVLQSLSIVGEKVAQSRAWLLD